MAAIDSVTDIRNTDAGQTAFTVRQNPVGGSTPCHALQVSQAARSGKGAGVNVVSNSTEAPAYRARAAGPLIQLHNSRNELVFEVSNAGVITTGSFSGALTLTSLETSGDVAVGDDLAVSGDMNITGYTTLAGGQANGDWAVFGAFSALGSSLGFFGTTATTKRTVSGSRGGNAALASLITSLAAYGLITDGSSA
jgi:hypothetical protein